MPDDPRKLRLYDLGPRDVLTVQCPCGQFTRFAAGELQRKYRVPSDMLIYDLQYRLRCHRDQCRRKQGMRILLWDGEPMPSKSLHDVGRHRVIVEGDINERIRVLSS
jgi:hypothetical protein